MVELMGIEPNIATLRMLCFAYINYNPETNLIINKSLNNTLIRLDIVIFFNFKYFFAVQRG